MKKILASLTIVLILCSTFSMVIPSANACPLFVQENAMFMTNMEVTSSTHTFHYDSNGKPWLVVNSTETSFDLAIKFHLNESSPAAFMKVLYYENETAVWEVHRNSQTYTQLTNGWNTLSATLPNPGKPGVYTARVLGVAGHRDNDGISPWEPVVDESFGARAEDWNVAFGDGYFVGRTAEELSWDEYEVAYQFGIKVCYYEGENPFIHSLSLTPSKTTLAPGETFTLTTRYYRTVYCPSDYFKVLFGKSVSYTVYATRLGLVGETTANGHVIQPRDHFVALPSRKALCTEGGHEYEVRVTYKGKSVVAPVWDVGPWNTKDDYWNPPSEREMWQDLPQGMPEAQAAYQWGYNDGKDQFGRTVTNPAGIDLADGTFWDDLGMTDNDWVTVEFLWMTKDIIEAGRWAAGYWQMVPYGWQTFTLTLTAPSTSGTYTVKAVGCSGHGAWPYYFDVRWDIARYDGGFVGHKPEGLSWNFYEISEEFKINVISPTIESFPKRHGYKCPDYLRPMDGDINKDGRSDWFYEETWDDLGNSVELWGIDPTWKLFDEYFAVVFGDAAGKHYFIGKCPFGGGINSGAIMHTGDINKNGKPDRFIEVIWRSEDGGSDDPGSAPGQDVWEYVFDVATGDLTETHYDEDGNVLSSQIRKPAGDWDFNDLEPIIIDFAYDEIMVANPSISIDFDPDTLNLKSKGNVITVYIELPNGYDVSQIDVSSIRLNGAVPALVKPTKIGDYDADGIPDLMVKFDRAAVIALFEGLSIPGDYVVEVTGTVIVPPVSFKGTDMIKVISVPE